MLFSCFVFLLLLDGYSGLRSPLLSLCAILALLSLLRRACAQPSLFFCQSNNDFIGAPDYSGRPAPVQRRPARLLAPPAHSTPPPPGSDC
jgi:hypothetical protein